MAPLAAQRRGLTPTVTPRDSPAFHVAGRYPRAADPETAVMHRTRGSSRDPRPALHHVMRALRVAPPAGSPRRRHPRSGHTGEALDCRHGVTGHLAPLPLTSGTASLVAGRALDQAEHLQPLAHLPGPWRPRVPAPLREAQAALAAADPPTMAPRLEGERDHLRGATDGDLAQRGRRLSAEPRRPQAQRPVAQPRRRPRAAAVNAFTPWRRTAGACDAAAQQALAPVTPGWPATRSPEVTSRPTRP
jgi:hypothetical protein